MEAFNLLRRKARENRDRIIIQARDDYTASLRRIAELEQDLLGRDRPEHRSIASCIEAAIPSDRVFNVTDILVGLEVIDQRRVWRKRSVDHHISRLRARGLVRRIQKSHGHEPAVYVRVGVKVEPIPFEGMTLPDAIGAMLAECGPLRTTEIAVKLLERGFHTTMNPKALRDAVGVVLRKGECRKVGDRWSC
jgi:hypothetical protein